MKFQPSAIAATNLSGKSGGTVATITNTFRRKSNPRQPNSSYQLEVRSRFGTFSSSWGTLTEAQQDAWIEAGPGFIFFKHGEAYGLKGNTLYQKLNNNLVRAGQDPITDPPLPAALPNWVITNPDLANDHDSMVMLFDMNTDDIPDGYTLMVIATPPMPPGRRSFENRFVELPPGSLISTGNVDAGVPYGDRFGPAAIGTRVGIGAYLINNTTGQATRPQYLQSVIIEA